MTEGARRKVFTCVADAHGHTGGRRSGADGVALSCDMEDVLDLEEGDIVKVSCSVLSGHRPVMSWERDRYPKPECAKYYDSGANSFEESDGSCMWGSTLEYYVPESFRFEDVEGDDADDMVKVTKDQMVNRTCVERVVLMVLNDCYRVDVEMKDGLIVRGKVYKKSGKALRKAGKLAKKLGCGLIGRLP